MEIFHYMRVWKSPTRMVSDMDAMLSFNLRCAHAQSYDLYCAQGLVQGSSLEKKLVSGGSFIRGKSVKEDLTILRRSSWPGLAYVFKSGMKPHSFIYLIIHLFIYLFIILFIYSFIHLCIYSFIHSFIHLFIYKPRYQILFYLKSSLMSYSALSASFEYLCYGSTAIIHIVLLECGDRL